MRACRASAATAICSTRCRACETNNNNVNTGPVFAHLPGPRRPRRRVASDGGRTQHQQSARRQPAAELHRRHRQRAGSDDDHVGRPRRIGNRRPHHEHRPEAGRQSACPGWRSSPASRKGCSRTTSPTNCRRAAPRCRTPCITSTTSTPRSAARSCKDKLWYYMSLRWQGQRQNTLNVYYNQNAGNANALTYAPDLNRPAFSDRTWENYTPRITWQATPRNKFTFSWDEQPVCRNCTGTTSLTGSPNFIFPTSPEADGHGEFSPQRVQQARWKSPITNKLLLEAGMGTTYYQWGGRELDPEPDTRPGAGGELHPDSGARRHVGDGVPVAELVEKQDAWHHVEGVGVLHHRVAQHEVRLPGQLLERRPRDPRQYLRAWDTRRSRFPASTSFRCRFTSTSTRTS